LQYASPPRLAAARPTKALVPSKALVLFLADRRPALDPPLPEPSAKLLGPDNDRKDERMSSRWSRAPRCVVGAVLALSSSLALAAGPLAAGSAQAAALPTLKLAVTKSSITVTGSAQSGAVNVITTGSGVKEAAAILVLLKPGVSQAEVEAFLATKKSKDPNYASKYGTIVFDTETNAGQTGEAQTNLQAGQYLALATEGEGGAKVRASFTVTAAPTPAALPAPQATVRTIEFGFRGPATLKDGELVRFENEGFLVHMDVAFPVKSMKVAKKVVKDLRTGKEKGLEKLVSGMPITFAGPLSSGAYQQQTITAKPGVYVQACFMDTQDGRSHTKLGMERIIKIAK
jgi:hypothetical protein